MPSSRRRLRFAHARGRVFGARHLRSASRLNCRMRCQASAVRSENLLQNEVPGTCSARQSLISGRVGQRRDRAGVTLLRDVFDRSQGEGLLDRYGMEYARPDCPWSAVR